MDKRILLITAAVLLILVNPAVAGAAYGINRTVNFQGKLVDKNGVNVPNSTPVTATFSVYQTNSSCPGGGTAVWSENQTFTPTDGIFQVQLGSVVPFGTNIDFSQDTLYLGLKISTEVNEMCSGSVRIKLAAVPQAFNAEKFAGMSGDNSQNNYFTITGGQGTPVTLKVNGDITLGQIITPTSAGGLTVESNGANTLTLDTGGNSAVNIGTGNSNAIILGRTGTGDYDGSLVKLPGGLAAQGAVAGKALVILNEKGDQNILAASAAGVTKFTVDRNGLLTTAGGITAVDGSFNITSDGSASFATMSAAMDRSINASNYGVSFTGSDNNPSCAAGDYKIYADTSDARLKKCQNGVVSDLANDGDMIIKAKSADQTVTNSTTLTDETALQFGIGGSEEWNVIWNLVVANDNNSAPGWKAVVAGPAANTCEVVQSGSGTNGEAFPQATTTNCSASPGLLVNSDISASDTPFNVTVTANIAGGGNPGTVKMQFAENTAGGGTSITVKKGSTMTAYRVTGADLAEFYQTRDKTLSSGDVVSLDSLLITGVKKSDGAYDPEVIGVISTKPGLILGDSSGTSGGNPAPVALSGRVPVKVTTENGPIKSGDMLTASSTPGVAMKLTKAGTSIGMAMTGYDAPGIGIVTVFIRTGYASGVQMMSLLSESNSQQVKSLLGQGETGRAALQYVLENGSNLNEDNGLSEMLTGRVVAGLEIITPKLTADQIFARVISPLGTGDLAFETNGGNVIFRDKNASESAMVIDASGSARFSGGITADWVKANRIEGLDVLSQKFSGLESQVASLSGEMAASPTPGLAVSTSAPNQDEAIFKTIKFDDGEAAVKFTIFGDLIASGSLVVNGPATFTNDVVFKNGPVFESEPVFGKDSAGMAVISKGTDRVDIVFDKEYLAYPMVSANMAFKVLKNPDGTVDEGANRQLEMRVLEEKYTYLITRETNKGFTIVLNKTAAEDIAFSWMVMAAKNPMTFTSIFVPPITATPEPAIMPTVIPTEIPQIASPSAIPAIATDGAGFN